MTNQDLERLAEVMRTVQADCKADSEQVDRTPFTARGVGETFGSTLAMIAATARACEVLAVELASTNRVLASRTEHLA